MTFAFMLILINYYPLNFPLVFRQIIWFHLLFCCSHITVLYNLIIFFGFVCKESSLMAGGSHFHWYSEIQIPPGYQRTFLISSISVDLSIVPCACILCWAPTPAIEVSSDASLRRQYRTTITPWVLLNFLCNWAAASCVCVHQTTIYIYKGYFTKPKA